MRKKLRRKREKREEAREAKVHDKEGYSKE